MKCPFPGMDPYIESPAIWPDFHQRFLTYLCDAIADRLPDRYDARLETQLRVVEAPPIAVGTYRPDISVTRATEWGPESSATSSVAILEPTSDVELDQPILEEVRDARINIHRWPESELITAIELLSPWNKAPGDGMSDFVRKRRALLMSPINWVEIDLLLGGTRTLLGPSGPPVDYQVVISRAAARRRVETFSWRLRDPLPVVPIPLRPPHSSIPISLADVFSYAYERGRIERALRTLPSGPPPNVANADDRVWAEQLAANRVRSNVE